MEAQIVPERAWKVSKENTGADRLPDVINFVKWYVEKLLKSMRRICNRYQEN